MSAQHTPATLRIQTRLERLELEHLRQLCVDQAARLETQAERIEQLERDMGDSDALQDFWHGHALDLQQTVHEAGAGQVGITQRGELLVLPPTPLPLQEASL